MCASKRNSEFRRKQIARATLALVGKLGFRRLTLAAVAREVGLVPSGIYRKKQKQKYGRRQK